MSEQDELLSVQETARRLNVHENTVRNMADDGRLTPVRSNRASGYNRFLASEVAELQGRQDVTRVPRKRTTGKADVKKIARRLRRQAAVMMALADELDPRSGDFPG